jgi:molybdopterin converting factor small subunit
MARILIPTPLRQFAEKLDTVEISGATAGEVLAGMTVRFPALKNHLFTEEGKLRSFVNLYFIDEDIRYTGKEATPVKDSDTLSIVPSIAGGKR